MRVPVAVVPAVVLAVALAAPAAHADPAGDTAAQVRAADIAFAKRAAEAGTAQAFREFMDPADGLEFGAGPPVRGAEAIFQSMGGGASSKSRLAWTPAEAWGATSGDLGVTTGTWSSTPVAGGTPTATGRYVTVCRRDAAGRWKGLIDIGTTDKR